jgi:hypothetical protein
MATSTNSFPLSEPLNGCVYNYATYRGTDVLDARRDDSCTTQNFGAFLVFESDNVMRVLIIIVKVLIPVGLLHNKYFAT